MTDRPINLLETDIVALRRHGIRHIRRPGSSRHPGLLGRAEKDDRLWVREPYHFAERFNGLRPCAIVDLGESVFDWPADAPGRTRPPAGAGLRRYARTLPRALHRAHLIVLGRRFIRLQDLTDQEIVAEGFRHREHFAHEWDRLQSPTARTLSGIAARWSDNPLVVDLTVEWVAQPI